MITLQIFIAVCETKSFTQAASKVLRTQSAVSQQIANLEEMLGVKLFKRGKKLEISNDGEVFYNYAKQILGLQHEAINRFKEPELEGEVRLGLPEDFAVVFLNNILRDFHEIHPRVKLNIECDLTLNLLDGFRRDEFDMVLIKNMQSQDFPHGVDVWTETLEWVGTDWAAVNNYIASGKPIPLVLSPAPCVYRSHALQMLEDSGLKWRIIFTSSSYSSKIEAIKAGLGISLLPRNMIPPSLNAIISSGLPKLNDIHICLMKQQNHNAVIKSLEDFILKELI